LAAKDIQALALDMKRHSLISIIERLQTEHALKAERERKDFHASLNGAVISGAPDKNGIPQKSIFENEQVGYRPRPFRKVLTGRRRTMGEIELSSSWIKLIR